MTAPLEIALALLDAAPQLHFASSIDVKVWMAEHCD
jgi:hypothetical protein